MKRRTFKGADVRRILASMVMNPTMCSRVASRWVPEGLFESRWANTIANWCVVYHRKYGEPPQHRMQVIFEKWADGKPREEIDAVEKLMAAISDASDDPQISNIEYMLDVASDHFNQVRMERINEHVQNLIKAGKVDTAIEHQASFRSIDLRVKTHINPADDMPPWEAAFRKERSRSVVRYTDAAGDFFDGTLNRGELYSFMGPDKTGKTSYLIDLTVRAAVSNNVAYFECGDGDEPEVLRRLGVRAAENPLIGGVYGIPIGWNEDGSVNRDDKHFDSIDDVEAFSAFRRVCKSPHSFRLSCHPNSSISVDDISGILEDWRQQDGWNADVVVMDYADILAHPKGIQDRLDQIDETWKRLRRLSQAHNSLVVTATQSDAGAYTKGDKGLLGKQNFSGRKTKLAHVNGMIGINVSPDERREEQGRLNWVVRRRTPKRNAPNVINVAGSFSLENPIIISSR